MAELRIYEEFTTHDDIEEPQIPDVADSDETDRVDVVEGPIGSASLKEPADIEADVDPSDPRTLDEPVDATAEPDAS